MFGTFSRGDTKTRRLQTSSHSALWRLAGALALGVLVAGCGGGDSGGSNGNGSSSSGDTSGSGTSSSPTEQAQATGTSRTDAFRLLTQATFGPTDADLGRAMSLGTSAWLEEQLAKPARTVHLARWDAATAAAQARGLNTSAAEAGVVSSFYREALTADDQVRQRMTFALSEIVVVSLAQLPGAHARMVASWLDMLNRNALGNYRTLLEEATLHPAMGRYLSTLGNVKEDPITGSTPDQNYARELMQLFTIGLVQLNADGSPKMGSNGQPLETYTSGDIAGLAKVFTGYNWAGTNPKAQLPRTNNFWSRDRLVLPMQAYPGLHSTSEKRFLGQVIPVQSTPNPAADRKVALDTVFNHPNVGPFIGRQLIQRLVTSQPSPAYVQRVAAAFANNGQGVRGDLKAVARAVLLDPEARTAPSTSNDAYGKIREPVLRLTALLRAYPTRSLSGGYSMLASDDPAQTIGQTPLGAPSVFNYFRPGYIPPGGSAAQRGITLPEMQITTETSVAGYANSMLATLAKGAGARVTTNGAWIPDLQTDYSADLPLASSPSTLVAQVISRLIPGDVPASLRTEIEAAVASIPLPAASANGSNATQVQATKQARVQTALLLTLVSPEFIVQK